MNFFFGFDVYLKQSIDWMFNLNHMMFIIMICFCLVALYYSLHAKSERGKRITKLSLALVLLVLEIGRIVYDALFHLQSNDNLDGFRWAWTISFQMCAIMCWTTIFTLIASCFLNKNNKTLVIFKNILLGASMLGGILTFVYPDCLSSDRPILHFLNFQTIIVHMLLIFVPIYLIKIGELEVRFKNLWMPALGFVGIGAISSAASHVSGENFAFNLGNPLFSDVGLDLPYPLHLPLTLAIIFVLPVIYYAAFEIAHQKRNAKLNSMRLLPFIFLALKGWTKTIFNFKEMTLIDYFYTFTPALITIACAVLILYIPIWQGIDVSAVNFGERSLKSWWGLITLAPFFALVALLKVILKNKANYYRQNNKCLSLKT